MWRVKGGSCPVGGFVVVSFYQMNSSFQSRIGEGCTVYSEIQLG